MSLVPDAHSCQRLPIMRRPGLEVGHADVSPFHRGSYDVKLSYVRTSEDDGTPEALVLNLMVGRRAAYVVDILHNRIKGANGSYADIPTACRDTINAIRTWAYGIPVREEAKRVALTQASAQRRAEQQAAAKKRRDE